MPQSKRLASHPAGAIGCRGFTRGVAQLGSVLRSGRRGRGFESRHPDRLVETTEPPLTCVEGQGRRALLLCLITALSGPSRQRRGSIPIDRGHPSSRSRIASWSSARRTYNCIVVAMSSWPMIGVEQVCVGVQGDVRWRVPQHPRQRQPVDTRADCYRRAGVAEVVLGDLLHLGALHRTGEPSAIGLQPGQVIGAVAEHQGQARGPHTDLPALPARTPAPAPDPPDGCWSSLRCDRPRAALRCHAHSAGDARTGLPYPQRHRFVPTDPAVRQPEHRHAMLARLGCNRPTSSAVKYTRRLLVLCGRFSTPRDRQPSSLDSVIENARQHAIGSDDIGSNRLSAHGGDPPLHRIGSTSAILVDPHTGWTWTRQADSSILWFDLARSDSLRGNHAGANSPIVASPRLGAHKSPSSSRLRRCREFGGVALGFEAAFLGLGALRCSVAHHVSHCAR